ncbi:Polynucleotide 5'-hydroxyl-kinase grc3 [Exophiala oligosperma]
MPANGERLSAVARQRRLREARSASSTPRASTPDATSQQVQPESVTIEQKPQAVGDGEADEQPLAVSNQFSTLVEASTVHFSSSREIENINERSVKKCAILGTCCLWVKEGVVSVYGAILQASTATFRIYSPANYALPTIEALTSNAEFELDSLGGGVQNLPYRGVRDVWPSTGAGNLKLSFHILGHSIEQDAKALRRPKELNTDAWKTVLSQFPSPASTTSRSSSSPRIVGSKGLVSLVDLDSSMPEFTPPGTISMLHIQEPVLGPPFTHLVLSKHKHVRVFRMHFLGEIDPTDLSDWHLERVNDLLALERRIRAQKDNMPVIIVVPKWLENIEQQTASLIWKMMQPTDIVCMDTRQSSPHLQPWKTLAETDGCRIHQIPAQTFDRIPPLREHELYMQSYFHMSESSSNQSYWVDTPVLALDPVNLNYGKKIPDIGGVLLLGGNVALEDTRDALEEGIAAILLVRQQHIEEDPASLDKGFDIGMDGRESTEDNGWRVSRTEEQVPRLLQSHRSHDAFPYSEKQSYCIGLGMVTGLNVVKRQISLVTPLPSQALLKRPKGCQLALVVQRATSDARFTSHWARREMRSTRGRSQDP